MITMEFIELHAIFKGSVQGVGFRASVRSMATKLEIVGTIQNLDDGSVELIGQAPKQTLETFILNIQNRFPASQISSISYTKPIKPFSSFTILI